jgi:RNA polymerase sigma-70 factor (ECF subfamily)
LGRSCDDGTEPFLAIKPTIQLSRCVEREVMEAWLAEDSGPGAVDARTAEEFELWVAPHVRAMSYLAARLVGSADRDDVVQESLTRAWRRWETYRPERGSPQAWLLAIVADRARRPRRHRLWVLTPEFSVPVEDGHRDLDLEQAIRSLPVRQRMAVELHYFVGLTTAETAAVLRCSEGTVKSNLHDARASLRDRLEAS